MHIPIYFTYIITYLLRMSTCTESNNTFTCDDITCEYCQNIFTTKQSYRIHLKKCDKADKLLLCQREILELRTKYEEKCNQLKLYKDKLKEIKREHAEELDNMRKESHEKINKLKSLSKEKWNRIKQEKAAEMEHLIYTHTEELQNTLEERLQLSRKVEQSEKRIAFYTENITTLQMKHTEKEEQNQELQIENNRKDEHIHRLQTQILERDATIRQLRDQISIFGPVLSVISIVKHSIVGRQHQREQPVALMQ
jgi:chromosome segregation ATPase